MIEPNNVLFLKENTLQKISIGLDDIKGVPIRNRDYVRRDCGKGYYIKGQVIYGFYSIGHDEWDTHFKTMGFAVKFSDNSGTTGIASNWEVIPKSEYDKQD